MFYYLAVNYNKVIDIVRASAMKSIENNRQKGLAIIYSSGTYRPNSWTPHRNTLFFLKKHMVADHCGWDSNKNYLVQRWSVNCNISIYNAIIIMNIRIVPLVTV